MPGYSLLGDPVQIDDRDACAFLFRIRLCLVHRFYRLHVILANLHLQSRCVAVSRSWLPTQRKSKIQKTSNRTIGCNGAAVVAVLQWLNSAPPPAEPNRYLAENVACKWELPMAFSTTKPITSSRWFTITCRSIRSLLHRVQRAEQTWWSRSTKTALHSRSTARAIRYTSRNNRILTIHRVSRRPADACRSS